MQPMPETTAVFFKSALAWVRARAKQLTPVPMPHPGHQMLGMRSIRK